MCMTRTAVVKTMLGNREIGYELWNGKEICEMTSKQIKDSIVKGETIQGLKIGEDGELVLDSEGFFARNLMLHSHVGNYKPMIEDESCVANVFYIVLGKNESGLYDVVSTKFERTAFTEEKIKAMYELGVISAGLKIEGDKLVLPVKEAQPKETKPEEAKPEEAKPETAKPEETKPETVSKKSESDDKPETRGRKSKAEKK